MKVFKQLVKEFSIPLILSVLWVLYNIFGGGNEKNWDTQKVVNVFGPTFFLLSWLTGQFFRIKKQTKVEDSFSEVEKKMVHLIGQIEEKTNEMISNITGGDSFAWIQMSLNDTNNVARLTLIHEGLYPLYDVNVRIVDVAKLNNEKVLSLSTEKNYTNSFTIGNMIPKHAIILESWQLDNRLEISYNIFFTARSGGFTQLLRLKKVEKKWVRATRVTNGAKVIFEKIDDLFPKDSDNNIKWE